MDDRESYDRMNRATEEMIRMRDPAHDVRSRQQRRFEERKGVREPDPRPANDGPLIAYQGNQRVDPTDPLAWGGKLNIYTCDGCRRHVVTRDVDAGTTPFMIPSATYCPGPCAHGDGRVMMTSSMYRVWNQSMREDYQWFKPTSVDGLTSWERDHVDRGGLLLRKAVHDVE